MTDVDDFFSMGIKYFVTVSPFWDIYESILYWDSFLNKRVGWGWGWVRLFGPREYLFCQDLGEVMFVYVFLLFSCNRKTHIEKEKF